jgi:hypothetical protein
MTLTESFVRDNICIDFAGEILYGSDQANLTYPRRFATVEFPLSATEGLIQIADRIRKDAGFRPIRPMDEYTDETCDNAAWYDFYTGISTFSENRMGGCIEFVVVNADSEDNEKLYVIELSEEEKLAVFNRLDEQCRQHLGKSCEELLQEARAELHDAPQEQTTPSARDGTSEEDTR